MDGALLYYVATILTYGRYTWKKIAKAIHFVLIVECEKKFVS